MGWVCHYGNSGFQFKRNQKYVIMSLENEQHIFFVMNSRRIALLGGSFDPIHLGHLAVAREVLNQIKVDRVWFLPAFKSPNKSTESTTSPEHRLAMVRSAVEGCADFEVCDLELKRSGSSYTYETLEELHRAEPETRWLWILGLDTFFDLPGWKNFNRILELADLIVAPRPGYDESDINEILMELGIDSRLPRLPSKSAKGVIPVATGRSDHQVHFLAQPVIDLSSNEIRRRFRQNPSIKKMLPPPVVQYIMDHHLYL